MISNTIETPTIDNDTRIIQETLIGILYAADSSADYGSINTDSQSNKINILVPAGLTDIVKMYFNDRVCLVVNHELVSGNYTLVSVEAISDEDSPTLFD